MKKIANKTFLRKPCFVKLNFVNFFQEYSVKDSSTHLVPKVVQIAAVQYYEKS